MPLVQSVEPDVTASAQIPQKVTDAALRQAQANRNSVHMALHLPPLSFPSTDPASFASLLHPRVRSTSAYLCRPVHQGQIVPRCRRIYPHHRGVPPSLGLFCCQETTTMV